MTANAARALKQIPFVVAGRRWASRAGEGSILTLHTGESVEMPSLSAAMVGAIATQDRSALADVPVQSIVAFLNNVGQNWAMPEYARRRMYVRYLVQHLGYSERMAETEANWIALLLTSHVQLTDLLENELGSRHALDTWVRRHEAEIRMFPRGRVLHVVAGNVPLSCVTSIVRGLITKNVCVVKAASSDPMTPVALALSFLDTAPDHPVSQALHVVHWTGGREGEVEAQLVGLMDGICAWGDHATMEWAARHSAPGVEMSFFGPKHSLAVVGRDADLAAAARAVANDVCAYDQRACFSARQVFVETPIVEPFVAQLQAALDLYDEILPRGTHGFDEEAFRTLTEREALFLGARLETSARGTWTIVVGLPGDASRHPLGRTVFVHPVAAAADAMEWVGPDVQTVGVMPWTLSASLRDRCARAGVARLVEIGMANVFRVGGAHDGMYPLQRLVRIAAVELPRDTHIRGMTIALDQTEVLIENRFADLIPR